MYQQSSFRYGEDDAVQVLEIPFGNDQLCMRIFLPCRANGLGALEHRFTAPRLAVLADKLQLQSVKLWLPRFTIESQPPLVEALRSLRMTQAFDPRQADFSAMSARGELFLSAVVQNGYIKVDEDGTKAAVATGIVGGLFGGSSTKRKPIEFKANHPFIFAIVHRKTDTMLFVGRLANP